MNRFLAAYYLLLIWLQFIRGRHRATSPRRPGTSCARDLGLRLRAMARPALVGCFAKLAATAAGWMCGERVIDFATRCGAQDEENVEHKNPLCGGLHPLQESDG